MNRLFLAPFAALALAGCVQTVVSPVSVTRFSGSEPARLGDGSISVRAADGGNGLEFTAWKQAVAAELARLGYRVVENEVSGQVAEVRVERTALHAAPRRSPVNVGVGGSTGSYGSGVGVGLGFDLSGPPPDVTANRLRVVIKDNGTGQALWEGRAEFSASTNSDYASAQAAADKMAAALFKGFPGESGATIEVK
ncbi:DUF4136 domain-containing protein [Altererythrobacter salegens]|uniref:DUF4136 domain-containing protein n=1 Tax=Croceibacterium salegens TaxID=1737568 RepID=A0A6I4T0C9_9SPHN|nr:DUF4136 domain-containing protein [Croceibacterium salegens]MXO61069.1 DUF4136 domain-containing protein [Croceibacterium salegens]